MPRILDISPPLSSRLAVWPGDEPFRRDVVRTDTPSGTVEHSSVTATLHLGAHADAPSHVVAGAPPVDRLPLEPFVGRCQVVDARVPPGGRVRPGDLLARVEAPRLLVRTGTYPDATSLSRGFAGLSVELAGDLASLGVLLVGIDTPSVDPFDDDRLEAHRALVRHGLLWLEGLDLALVEAGLYTLVALPLRIEGADASPVRAVLLDDAG